MRHRLLEARNSRVHPETDTKILSAWNGLMIGGLVRAWQATGHAPALVLAQRIADFIVDHMLYDAGTKIHRVYKDGATKLEGTLDDYAFVARGLQRLAEATGDRAAWDRAGSLIETVVERFYEERDGVGIFYMTPVDAAEKLFHRPESHQDGAIPSGAAVAVECLLRIALVTESEGAMDIAERYLAGRAPEAGQTPFIGSCLLSALDLYLNGSTVVITDGDGRAELETAVFRLYAPTVMVAGPWAAPSLTAGKQNDAQGRAQVYVCRGSTCSAPVSAVDAVANLLTAR